MMHPAIFSAQVHGRNDGFGHPVEGLLVAVGRYYRRKDSDSIAFRAIRWQALVGRHQACGERTLTKSPDFRRREDALFWLLSRVNTACGPGPLRDTHAELALAGVSPTMFAARYQ